MLESGYFLILSKQDGRYLVAHPSQRSNFVLLFQEYAEALSYLNTHAQQIANRFVVESLSKEQIQGVIKRWGFDGVGLVQDPLEPRIEWFSV